MKGIIALVVSVLLGIIAVLAVRSFLAGQEQRVQIRFQPVSVVKTAQRIEKGARITLNMISDTPGTISRSEFDDQVLWRDRSNIIGLTANRDIERGTNIKASFFQLAEQKATLPPGRVLLSLPVDNVSGAAGNIRPGSHVDIIGAFTLPVKDARGGATSVHALRMLTDVQVIAVDNRTSEEDYGATSRGGRQYSTVSLAVTPQEAVILTYARAQGALTLSIRNQEDKLSEEPTEISIDNILDMTRKANSERRSAEPVSSEAAVH